jgi:twinkle protein
VLNWKPPGTGKFLCPECSATRKKKREKCVKVWEDADGELFWKCYNPGCGFTGTTAAAPETQRVARSARDFRRTSREVRAGDGYSPRQGMAVGSLRRARPSGEPQVSADLRKAARDGHRGRLSLWNHDCLLEDSKKPVVICEGEWDALVAIGLGFRAVSVPNGASGGEGELSYLWDARDLLNRVDEFIIATDSDDAGIKLRSNIVAHLGADRCSFVEYGADCKDLNETLLTYGVDVARTVLENAKAFPVKGLYTVDDFPERPALTVWSTGIEALDDTGEYDKPALAIIPGTLTVFTGHANMGKSTVMDSIVASLLKRGIPTCLASFETDIKPILVNDLRRTMLGIASHELDRADTSACDRVIREKLQIISQSVDEDEEMNLEYFLDLCRTSVLRRGTRVIIIDPWNELEHKMRQGENETAYIGRALRAIKRFAKVYDVAVWIVAHPTKPFEGKVRMPRLLDISGSANWANKADFGLSYHRTDKNVADLA